MATLPYVNIKFENGVLGSTTPSDDGVSGILCTAVGVAGDTGFQLKKPYTLRKYEDILQYGITAEESDANAFLYKLVKEFYDEAGEGAELWIMGLPNTETLSNMVDPTQDYSKYFIKYAKGTLRTVGVAYNPASSYVPTMTKAKAFDDDVLTAMENAQKLGEWATNSLYAPFFTVLETREYTGVVSDLPDLKEYPNNRVGLLIGDTVKDSKGASIGTLLGRIARIPVQRHIGRVKDLKLSAVDVWIKDKEVEEADIEGITKLGYITFRTITGKAGYFFNDDNLATAVKDDYRSIARRRTADKAYRIAYTTIIENLNDELPITDSGELDPAMAKSWESDIVTAIADTMGAEGNLGVDKNNPSDKGVKCFIDYKQKVATTSQFNIALKVKPYAYAKYIDVALGFLIEK